MIVEAVRRDSIRCENSLTGAGRLVRYSWGMHVEKLERLLAAYLGTSVRSTSLS